jgi:3-oxoacyl-[acyl-carrier protein] reductase
MRSLDGKVALVTGGSRGIGRAISERLAAEGALVAVHHGTNVAAAAETVTAIEEAGGRAFAVRSVLGRPGDSQDLFAAVDAELEGRTGSTRLDILVSNAGIVREGLLGTTTPEIYDEQFAVNTRASFFVVQGAVARMEDGGRVVLISTGLTKVAQPDLLAYAMSKGAIDAMALTLAKELGPRGITVNSIAPGVIDTDMNASWLRASTEARDQAAAQTAFGRVGEPDDVADVVAFVASEDARWITGHYLDATGGSLL